MKVTLKDGSVREYAQPMAVIDIAKDISEGLARNVCAATVNGEGVDIRTVIDKDSTLVLHTFDDQEGKAAFWHTTSHILAQAVKRLFPETKLAIGPSIAEGFYYDFDRPDSFTADDLTALEAEMKKIVKENLASGALHPAREMRPLQFMQEKEEPYKVELIEDLPEGRRDQLLSAGRVCGSVRRTTPDDHQRRRSRPSSSPAWQALTGEAMRTTRC